MISKSTGKWNCNLLVSVIDDNCIQSSGSGTTDFCFIRPSIRSCDWLISLYIQATSHYQVLKGDSSTRHQLALTGVMSFYFRIRYFIVFLCSLISFTAFFNRSNVSIAMPSMVRKLNVTTARPDLCPSLDLDERTEDNDIISFRTLMGPAAPLFTNVNPEQDGTATRFGWDPEWQGILMGCFFWSHCLFQIPVGILISRIGASLLVIISCALCSVISIASPFAAEHSVYAFIVCRVALGISTAVFLPASFVIVCYWVPVRERSTALAVAGFGKAFANVLLFFSSGFLINAYSWKSLFFLPGIVSFNIFLILLSFLRNRPEDHCLVSVKELAIISGDDPTRYERMREDAENTEVKRNETKTREPIPWIGIMTNKAVLAWIAFKATKSYICFLIVSEMPTYLVNVLHMDVVTMGIMTAIHSICGIVTGAFSARLSEWFIEKRWCSRTKVRKIFSLLNGFVEASLMLLIPIVRCNRLAVLILYNLSSLMEGLIFATHSPLPAEMSTKFHGIIFTIGNLFATAAGFIAPMVAGFVLKNIDDEWLAWDVLFISGGSLVLVTNVTFLLFASAERQKFDLSNEEKAQLVLPENSIWSIFSFPVTKLLTFTNMPRNIFMRHLFSY